MEAIANPAPTENKPSFKRYSTVVKAWLALGLFMIFMQVVVGGITRLTGSGLSITKWEIVTGTLPPLNAQQWEEAFNLYKATPQYAKINQGMTMGEFKFIYFWEYIHRLWARLMGFVFIIPLAIFWARGMVDKPLLKRLGVVFLLAALVASFGWIMVASGLIERPWVNAYKLTMHLSLALILFSYLLWTTFNAFQPARPVLHSNLLKNAGWGITSLIALQIILGGIMAGSKAGLFYPTWPDMNGEAVPAILMSGANWTVDNLVNYDSSLFLPALVQLLHRTTAYVLTIIILWFSFKALSTHPGPALRVGIYMLITVLAIQMLLGILTVVNALGAIPVGYGVFHQAGALLLLTAILFINYQLGKARN